ncbi:Glutaminyl-tRNA synthetase [Mitosporidium daphniae]
MASTAGIDDLISKFTRIGIDIKKAKETASNSKFSSTLTLAIDSAGVSHNGCPKPSGMLLYTLASTCPKEKESFLIPILSKAIADNLITRDVQIQSAISDAKPSFSKEEIYNCAGIGVSVSESEIDDAISRVLNAQESPSSIHIAQLLKLVRDEPKIKFANGKTVKERAESLLLQAQQKRKENESVLAPVSETTSSENFRSFYGAVLKLHKPGENPQLSEEIRQAHLKATGGRVVTRFPPEPNGFLHIGHAKAINFNFNYAKAHGGYTYLRFDDTNPEAEKPIYYDAIRESVQWLGFTPCAETASSDYFQKLYDIAKLLVSEGKAYVCHQTAEEIHASRGGDDKGPRTPSPWRDRPIEESVRIFQEMYEGKWKPETATLRLRQDMDSHNPFMWDLVAYRILDTPHCLTGSTWHIYPMYDYTHCLCDSFENISHSFCTTEFILAREAYYWVCDAARVYKPVQWEYGRLNITNTVLSKRKLTKLVSSGVVDGWDDPRIYTIAGIRRRGFTPEAVNKFVENIGITTAFTTVDVRLLESYVREHLNEIAPRVMAILEPLHVEISLKSWNEVALPAVIEAGGVLRDDGYYWISVPDFPSSASTGKAVSSKWIPISRTISIDRSDFDPNGDSDYRRLTLTQPVGLFKASFSIQISPGYHGNSNVLPVEAVSVATCPPRTFIQWVESNKNCPAEIRLYSDLFKSLSPDDAPGGWLSDIAESSLIVHKHSMVDLRVSCAPVESKFQFQRLGYFCVDKDSSGGNLVFNRTVTLKEDPTKKY